MFKHSRLFTLGIFLLTSSGFFAQTSAVQASVHPADSPSGLTLPAVHLFQNTNILDASAARFAQNAQFLLLQPEQLKNLLSSQPQNISLVLPYRGQLLHVDLVRVELNAGTIDANLAVQPGLHYRGQLHGSTESLAAFSFFEDEVMGFVSDVRFNNLVLGPVQLPGNMLGYMLYSDLELVMDNPFDCVLLDRQQEQKMDWKTSASTRKGSVRTLQIALEADYSLVQNRGSAQATANYLSALFNQLATVFALENIELALSNLIIPATARYDYTAGNAVVLNQLLGNQNRQNFDLIQLVGLAQTNPESATYLDGLCSSVYGAAYCALEPSFSNVPTHSWALSNLAHELGHQLGAQHTQWCGWPGGAIESCSSGLEGKCATNQDQTKQKAGNTLMSYCLLNGAPPAFSAGLGSLPGHLIRKRIGMAACLQADEPAVDREFNRSQSHQFELVPNPGQQQVQIRLGQTAATRLVVLDLLGRSVLTRSLGLDQNQLSLDLSGFEKGVYLVQVFENDTLLATRRLIKN